MSTNRPLSFEDLATKGDVDAVLAQINAIAARLDLIAPVDELHTIPAAASKLMVSESTIRRRIRDGQLEARGNGKTRQVRL